MRLEIFARVLIREVRAAAVAQAGTCNFQDVFASEGSMPGLTACNENERRGFRDRIPIG